MGFLVVLAGIAAFEGSVAMSSTSDWFASSAQVVWTPPQWFSRAAWAVVFLLLALAGWCIWRGSRSRTRLRALALYVAALVLLTVWPPVYLHGYPVVGTAALWIGFALGMLLVGCVVVLIALRRRTSALASILLVPVAIWLFYVTTINLGDAVLASLE